MDMGTAKLVAFALWAESNEGVTGKSPEEIKGHFLFLNLAKDRNDLYLHLGPELDYKLDNYLTVWAAAEEPKAPSPKGEAEATPTPETPWTPGQPLLKSERGKEPVEVPETPTEEAPKPKPKRGKRGR